MEEKLFGKEITWIKGFGHAKQFGHAARYPFSATLTRHKSDKEEYSLAIKIDGRSSSFLKETFVIGEKNSIASICKYADEKCQQFMNEMKWWFDNEGN